MSCLMTSVNSVKASPSAPLSARLRSCRRRASDSMTRSSTTSCAHVLAVGAFIEGLKAITFVEMLTAGIGGSTQTLAEAETGPELLGGGRGAPALPESQVATAGPEPSVSARFGVETWGSAGAGA